MKYIKLFENYLLKEGITFSIKDYGKETSVDTEGNIVSVHKDKLENIFDICWAFKSEIAKHNLIGRYKQGEYTYPDVEIEPDV